MSAPIIDVAEEVKDLLNAGEDFSQAFTAVRTYVPKVDLETLRSLPDGSLSVFVFPNRDDRTIETRGSMRNELRIDIGIRKKLSAATDPTDEGGNTALDAMMDFVQEIKVFFEPPTLEGGVLPTSRARWVKTENPAVYDGPALETLRVFISVVSLTFKKL